MDFDPAELDTLSREDLILRARARGVDRPEQMTRVELRDEIVRLSEPDLERQRRSRGWLGVARDLLASVVESGLNLPDAAAAIRGDTKADVDLGGPPPVATVTLAEIYAAQGHYDKALRMLDEVLEREPDHAQALASRRRLLEERELGPGRRRRSDTAVVAPPSAAAPEPVAVEAAPEPVAVEAAPEPVAVEAAPEAVAVAAAPEAVAVAAAPEPTPTAIVAEAVAEAAVEAVAEALAAAKAVAEVAAEAVAEAAAEAVVDAIGTVETVASTQTADVAADEVAAAPTPSNGEPALLVLHAADRAFVYWRLSALSDSLRLRSVTVRPAAHGATIEEEDHRLTRPVGGFWLPRLAPGTEVRAALGELHHDGFAPVTVARVVDSSNDIAFEPPGASSDAELEAAARSAAGL
jgi:hypothetical protein